MYEFKIDGSPVPWKAHGGYGRKSFNRNYEEKLYYQVEIKKQYHHDLPITVAVKFDYTFYMPIPKATSNKQRGKILEGRVRHIKRPDVTNCVKFIEDCFKGIVINDDSQVIEINARKVYGEDPRTIVKIDIA
jgi:Holliday junction resolvase RusA-like endonuclease